MKIKITDGLLRVGIWYEDSKKSIVSKILNSSLMILCAFILILAVFAVHNSYVRSDYLNVVSTVAMLIGFTIVIGSSILKKGKLAECYALLVANLLYLIVSVPFLFISAVISSEWYLVAFCVALEIFPIMGVRRDWKEIKRREQEIAK